MRPSWRASIRTIVWGCLWGVGAARSTLHQKPLAADDGVSPTSVSTGFFMELERLARLVDISYCVGTTGISPPFQCVSRCSEFPDMELVATWNTGMLLSDSCGYIALDHGKGNQTSAATVEGANDKAIIVAFRGTYSITNTVVDLSTTPQEYVPYPEPDDDDDGDDNDGEREEHCTNCTVHMGFLSSWRSARKMVLPALKRARADYPSYPIYLVGHSLGGAVAALAALELKVALRWDDVVVTTFGEPRVGNKGLREFIDRVFDVAGRSNGSSDADLERRTYRRVSHANDPVPLLPLTEWGYRAHAGEVFIAKPDLQPAPEDLRMCRGDEDARCSAGAETSADMTFVSDFMRDVFAKKGDLRAVAKGFPGIPARLKLWQLFFAHRDYFWRLGLCVPGGDPTDWGRDKYHYGEEPESMDDL
jgi:pimeloyl-ACP methyl ester carboxylesterase